MDCQKGKYEAATWRNGNQSHTAIFRVRTEANDFFCFFVSYSRIKIARDQNILLKSHQSLS
jgi:hypothetical protein